MGILQQPLMLARLPSQSISKMKVMASASRVAPAHPKTINLGFPFPKKASATLVKNVHVNTGPRVLQMPGDGANP
jgi:hypothetical protein